MNEVAERGWQARILTEFMLKQFRSRDAKRYITDGCAQ